MDAIISCISLRARSDILTSCTRSCTYVNVSQSCEHFRFNFSFAPFPLVPYVLCSCSGVEGLYIAKGFLLISHLRQYIYKNKERIVRLRRDIMSKNLIILIILVLMGSLLIAGCMTSTNTENKTANATTSANVTTGANVMTGSQIGVAEYQDFTIRLRSNPSTGHRWQENYDSTYVSPVSKTFQSDPNPSGMVGVGGYDVYAFKALKSGTTVIRFDNISPAQQVVNCTTYTIVIT
jgi:predicted secreted protein